MSAPAIELHHTAAIERAIERLQVEMKELSAAGNYDAMFPEGDIKSLREVMAALRAQRSMQHDLTIALDTASQATTHWRQLATWVEQSLDLPNCIAETQRELAALRAQGIPEGWRLVPVDPTTEMLAAARNAPQLTVLLDSFVAQQNLAFKTCYAAMLLAAPHPQGEEHGG
jgi:hypothetical protein